MVDTANLSGNYRIEVSGWGLNDAFFVEKTELQWTEGADKKLLLRHAVSEGAVIFEDPAIQSTLWQRNCTSFAEMFI